MMRESDAYMTVSPNFSPLFAGLGYGSALMVLGFVAAGAGHGTYVILGLSSSPLPLLAAILGIFGGPLVWGTIGGAFAFRRYAFGRRAFVGLLASHYAGLWPVLTSDEFGDWSYVAKVWRVMPLVLSAGAILYFGGQIALWGLLFGTSNLPGEASNRRFQFSLRRLLLTITLIAIALACLPNNDPFLQAIGVAALSVAGIVVAEPGRHHSAPRPQLFYCTRRQVRPSHARRSGFPA